MPRYLLCPGKTPNTSILYPTDSEDSSPKQIKLDDALVESTKNVLERANDQSKVVGLLHRLILDGKLTRTKDGLLSNKDRTFLVSYDDALVDSCNCKFKQEYEIFYCLLRKYGITW